jgi:hypothetical protein
MWIYQDSVYPGRCRGCGRAIVWAETRTGAKHPFDGTPIPVTTQPDLFSGRILAEIDTTITLSHFATCARAQDFRSS